MKTLNFIVLLFIKPPTYLFIINIIYNACTIKLDWPVTVGFLLKINKIGKFTIRNKHKLNICIYLLYNYSKYKLKQQFRVPVSFFFCLHFMVTSNLGTCISTTHRLICHFLTKGIFNSCVFFKKGHDKKFVYTYLRSNIFL